MTSTAPALRVGTRGSALALTQTQTVADALRAATGREVELVRVTTTGDRSTAPLSTLGGTGAFAAALRQALLDGECDVAVHSLKDLPTAPSPGLSIAAVPARADHRDALCAREQWTLDSLPRGARVGTGSPRRAAQLRLARPDLDVQDIRGNVGTRLARVAPGDLDAVVLAQAGLARLDLLDPVTQTLGPEVMLPAPGQGALAVECRTADLAELGPAMAELEDLPTRWCVTAERAVLATLEVGCAAPVGAYAHTVPTEDGLQVALHAAVVEPAGARRLERRGTVVVPPSTAPADGARAAAELGARLARELLADGAAALADLPATSV